MRRKRRKNNDNNSYRLFVMYGLEVWGLARSQNQKEVEQGNESLNQVD